MLLLGFVRNDILFMALEEKVIFFQKQNLGFAG